MIQPNQPNVPKTIQVAIKLLTEICQNIGHPLQIEQNMLADYHTYFDICQLVFSELSIEITKIQEEKHARPGQKLQQLINFLNQRLEINLEAQGEQIVRFNLRHICKIIQFLFLYTNIYVQSNKPVSQVKSVTDEAWEQKDAQRPIFSSARGPQKKEKENKNQKNQQKKQQNPKHRQHQRQRDQVQHNIERNNNNQHHQNQQEIHPEKDESYLIPQKAKKKKAQYSSKAKRARSQTLQNKNLHIDVVHKIMEEKTKILKAANRDNRKSRLQAIKLAKNSYKIYLRRYTKENRAENGRKKSLKQKSTAKPISQQLPLKDFDVIDNFFESFTYKFRDKKAAYLRRIQKLIHQQELDRYCHQNKIQRQQRKAQNDRLNHDLKCQDHQHRVRFSLLEEGAKELDQNIVNMKKQMKLHESRNKREMKELKKSQLQQIQNKIRQDNQKMLMNLEEGGRLQQIILQMYKRF